jgi:hypothetical protein
MPACTIPTTRAVARASAAVLLGLGLATALVGPAEALGLPDPATPLVAVTTPVTDTVDQLTRPLTGNPAPAPAPAPAPGPSAQGNAAPAPSGGQGKGQSSPSARGTVGGDDLVAVDAKVDGLLGLCVRVPADGSKPRADVEVLDRDLIRELSAQGVPLREIVEPCPAGLGAPGTSSPGRATSGSPASQAASAVPAADGAPSADPRLAFTGAEVVPTAVLAVGLLWLGIVLTLASRRLVPVSSPARQGA